MPLITIEGLEGSGKTTQLNLLNAWLMRVIGHPVLVCRSYPGSIQAKIFQIVLDTSHTSLFPETEALLFAAIRSQTVREQIYPRLRNGDIVLCDRFIDSFIAYQGYGYGLPLNLLNSINEFVTMGIKPDMTIYLDIGIDVGLERKEHSRQLDRIEAKQKEFFKRVQQGYYDLIQQEPERWVIIDGHRSPSEIHNLIIAGVSNLLKRFGIIPNF